MFLRILVSFFLISFFWSRTLDITHVLWVCYGCQVGRHISILFDSTLEDPSLLTIPQHLLANEAASCTFADVLLSFLVHQMDDLAGYEER